MSNEIHFPDDIEGEQLVCAKQFMIDMIEHLNSTCELINSTILKVDDHINSAEASEIIKVCVSVKQFILQLHSKLVDQIFCLEQSVEQLIGLIEEYSNNKQSLQKVLCASDSQAMQCIQTSIESLEKVANIYSKLTLATKDRNASQTKAVKEIKLLLKQYFEAKSQLNATKSQCIIKTEIANRQHVGYEEIIKQKQKDILMKFSGILSCAVETIINSFSSLTTSEKIMKIDRKPLQVKFRDFDVPEFKPYVFKNKHHTLDPAEAPPIHSVIVPFGIAQVNSLFIVDGRTFVPGEKVLLMDNTDRPYAAVEIDLKIFYVPRKSLTVLKFGPPSNPGPISINEY